MLKLKLDKAIGENKKKNIVIHGVEENETNYAQLENKTLELINTKTKVAISQTEIDFMKRIGTKKDKKNRPILVGLTTWNQK